MKDLTTGIAKYRKHCGDMRKKLLTEIKHFVLNKGIAIKKEIVFSFDSDINEVTEPVYLMVLTDRHLDEYGMEMLESISVGKKNELFFGTNSDTLSQHEMKTSDLAEIYEFLYYLETEELDGLEIKNGKLTVTEEN